jgi:hypothetical protein
MFGAVGSTDGPEPPDSSPHEPKRTPVTPAPYRSIANRSHQATNSTGSLFTQPKDASLHWHSQLTPPPDNAPTESPTSPSASSSSHRSKPPDILRDGRRARTPGEPAPLRPVLVGTGRDDARPAYIDTLRPLGQPRAIRQDAHRPTTHDVRSVTRPTPVRARRTAAQVRATDPADPSRLL